jgi:hypothetical protein
MPASPSNLLAKTCSQEQSTSGTASREPWPDQQCIAWTMGVYTITDHRLPVMKTGDPNYKGKAKQVNIPAPTATEELIKKACCANGLVLSKPPMITFPTAVNPVMTTALQDDDNFCNDNGFLSRTDTWHGIDFSFQVN